MAQFGTVVLIGLHKSDCFLQGARKIVYTMYVVVILEFEEEVTKADGVSQPEEQSTHNMTLGLSFDSRLLVHRVITSSNLWEQFLGDHGAHTWVEIIRTTLGGHGIKHALELGMILSRNREVGA
jgi:hypothetical protein